MNHGTHGSPAISVPGARIIAMPWILLLDTTTISSSFTTAESPATSDFYAFLFEEIPALLHRWHQQSGR
jgi:hypothetical protein